jgi:hypothetical protein
MGMHASVSFKFAITIATLMEAETIKTMKKVAGQLKQNEHNWPVLI